MANDDYRQHLVETYEQLSIGFAQTLITLAGGALALSLTFSKDIVASAGDQSRGLLIAAWVAWSIALTSVLIGYYSGRHAAWYARQQLDSGRLTGENKDSAGGPWTNVTHIAGFIGLVAFVIGVIAIVIYVSSNLGR